MVPEVGSSTPRIMLMVVVFPAPFGPSKPRISWVPTENDTSATATVAPYCLHRRDTARMGTTVETPADCEEGDSIIRGLQHRWLDEGALIQPPSVLVPQEHHVHVNSKAHVVGEIPSRMIRIVVNNDVVGIP